MCFYGAYEMVRERYQFKTKGRKIALWGNATEEIVFISIPKINFFYIFPTKLAESDLIHKGETEASHRRISWWLNELQSRTEQNSYQEIRNSVVILLPHLGVSPVLLCDKTNIMAGFPEERVREGQGPWAAVQLLCSAEQEPCRRLSAERACAERGWLVTLKPTIPFLWNLSL